MSILKHISELLFGMPNFDIPVVPQRPKTGAVRIEKARTITDKVVNGVTHKSVTEEDGTITTHIGKAKPKSESDVTMDKYDIACLDFFVGAKWRKSESRAIVIKWHWLKGESALQIEKSHTDQKTKQLEKGYSERSVSEYIKAFYDADTEREKAGAARLRDPKDTKFTTTNTVEW